MPEAIDTQARSEIAVLQSQQATMQVSLDRINETLNHIFISIIVAMAGGAGAAFYNVVWHVTR